VNRFFLAFVGVAVVGAPVAGAAAQRRGVLVAPSASAARVLEVERAPERRLPPASYSLQDPADSLWRLGRRALADEDYRRAAELFGQIVSRYPRSEYAGNALYWRAYALFQNGRPADLREALAAIDRQARDYEDADSRQDAKTLRTRLVAELARQGDEPRARELEEQGDKYKRERGCSSDDDEIRLAALNGLMQMDSESALPILKEVLAKRESCSEKLRKSAVFIVSQKRGDEATSILLEVARTDPSREVRGEAIQWLGQARSERAAAALDSIVTSSTEDDILEKAIFALSQRRSPAAADALRRLAQNPRRSSHVRSQAIFWLGQTRRDPEDLRFLRDLFGRADDEEVRNNIIQAIAQSKSSEGMRWLLDLARDKSLPTDARKNSLFWAGQNGMELRQLIGFYDELRGQEEMQNQMIFVLSQRRESEATDKLMDIALNDSNREVRKQAIFWLGQKKDPRVQKFLLDLINR
jgi:HEAT repeat protein